MTQTASISEGDADLLRRYVEAGCGEAFGVLAGRYLPLVYSAALRQTRDAHLAEDVAQAALVVLSQKAGGVEPALLAGWLLKVTHYAARNALRQRARRVAHERRAAAMRSEVPGSGEPDGVARVIDAALARLRDVDRTAVVLRYFQDKSFAEIAGQLRTSEAAAQRRVARAVEKLRGILAWQGVTISPAALPAALAAQALHHQVPSSLVLRATSVAGSKAGSTSLIAKGALHAMAAAKLKAAVAVAAAVLLVGAAVPTAYHYATARPGPEPAVAELRSPLPPGTDMSRPVAGSLPPGMTVEPLAVMNLSDKRWIRPTGGELLDPPEGAKSLLLSHVGVPGATHALLFRLECPYRDISCTYSLASVGSYGVITTYDAKAHTNYGMIVFAPVRGADSTTLTVAAATGPWIRNVTLPATATTPVSVPGVPFTFDAPTQDAKFVHIKRVTSRTAAPRQVRESHDRFYAVDVAGKEVSYIGMSSTRQYDSYDFKGPLSNYKEFRMETRTYNYRATYAAVPLPHAKR